VTIATANTVIDGVIIEKNAALNRFFNFFSYHRARETLKKSARTAFYLVAGDATTSGSTD
jgi:hypothetical protein